MKTILTTATHTAYLHFGEGDEPRLTIIAEVKQDGPDWVVTLSEIAKPCKMPYKVKHEGRWFRVWRTYYSFFIKQNNKQFAIVQILP